MDIIKELQFFFTQYYFYIILLVAAALISFLFTPITGEISRRIGAVDVPGKLRNRNDPLRERKQHDDVMPNLGGLAIFFSILIMFIYLLVTQDIFHSNFEVAFHVILAVAIIAFMGWMDSSQDIPAAEQLAFQVVAALLITTAGIKISNIDVLYLNLNFDVVSWQMHIGSLVLYISPIADLITVVWIVGMINAMNWVSGIDGLAASISVFAAITLTLIGVKTGFVFAAMLSAITAGAVLGFLPFNLPPAKTFNGSIGDMLQGLLLSVLGIMSGAKLSVTIILLAIPIIDALWVIIGRLRRHKHEIRSIVDLMKISDKTHLHHRLLSLGLSIRQALLVELLIFLGFCVLAYYLAGFSNASIGLLIAIGFCVTIFLVISYLQRKKPEPVTEIPKEPGKEVVISEETPEEKYAY
jgi:UDP-GlcNAc:undecaprenyl-phosphate GlcNAc-1-phosphate transferase